MRPLLPADSAALIGPNAILRVADALAASPMAGHRAAVFDRAGLSHYLATPPQQMLPQTEVQRLHAAMRETLGWADAQRIAADAGTRTAHYLLAHRIPRPVQALLRVLPARLAAWVLLSAIRRHAWTFAGSGRFTARAGHPVVLEIAQNPLCEGLRSEEAACAYYAATFETLFQTLVHRRSQVRETACEVTGADACRFEVRWDDALPPHDRSLTRL
jgi:divinyl protochlorophyllide a 8-vinyl-reductase